MRGSVPMAVLVLTAGLAGCAAGVTTLPVKFTNVTPVAPQEISATLVRPAGEGPFPAVVQLHGCGGLQAQSYRWARWLADRGYVALVVDSFGPRRAKGTAGRARMSRRSPHASTTPSAPCAICRRCLPSAPTVSRPSAGPRGESTRWR